jgi:hypothetical protein
MHAAQNRQTFSFTSTTEKARIYARFSEWNQGVSLAFPTDECETNWEPLIMSVYLDRNKRVSCKLLMMSGLPASQRKQGSSERPA